jgi:hypothetical protein
MSLKRVFCVFALLDKFLRGDGLSFEKAELWKMDDTSDEKLREKYVEQETPDEILNEIIASTPFIQEDRQEKWTIIVFSEAFFSDDPWDSAEIEKIKRCCRLLTDKHKNVIISANFLHKYRGTSDTPSRCKPLKEKYIVTNDAARLKQNRSSNLRFSNCSLIFWNGIFLSCYRKTTYKGEVESENKDEDNILKHGYGYDFGNWKSYAPPELSIASDDHKEFAKLFNSGRRQIVVSRTCYDMNFTPALSKQIKLLILTTDDPPGLESWKAKVSNAITCVCDACNAEFLVIFGMRHYAMQINVSSFIFNKLSCIFTICYGDVLDEIVDAGCC